MKYRIERVKSLPYVKSAAKEECIAFYRVRKPLSYPLVLHNKAFSRLKPEPIRNTIIISNF
jgi:hypothetical protein